MSIFVDETTRVVYQGLTGSAGRFYGLRNRAYGTQVVAGTNPKRAGEDVEGIPVFATVGDARVATGANASCIFVPAPGVESAVMEAAAAGIDFITSFRVPGCSGRTAPASSAPASATSASPQARLLLGEVRLESCPAPAP